MICESCGRPNDDDARFCSGCGNRLEPAVSAPAHPPGELRSGDPRQIAGGRYEVVSFLGEGGRKRVYRASDIRLDRDVAVAIVKMEGLDEQARLRVEREARAMGRLGDHPNIVTVHDIGDEDGRPYIVSQFMAGGSVAELLDRSADRRLSVPEAGRIARDLCLALEHAHARGVVHRDVKPANVWLTDDGAVKLGDFGLASAAEQSKITIEGMMLGTVSYMSPEQALGRPADARSDVYSLGAVLYEMLCGRPPFLGDDVVSIISQHLNTVPVAPTWHNPDVPAALEELVLRMLAKAPDDRPESATKVREALDIISAATTETRIDLGEANPLDRLAGGIFVGREREMEELRASVDSAQGGHGRLVLLVGEPGIGKTRTADEVATYARLRGMQILVGRCYEGEGAPAFWPWVQVIRSYVMERDPALLAGEMGTGAADIAQVVSEIRERLPDLPPPLQMEPEQARFRLFDSVTTFLKNASRGRPLMLVLDDLHWADKPSLLLLQFLTRELRTTRILVIGTYRDVELGRHHPLARTIADLAREHVAERVSLSGLGYDDVARYIEMTAGITPPKSLVTAVHRETEGNPFFLAEVVRLLASEGRLQRPDQIATWSVTIPQGVREVVGRRLDHLSPECNEVLTVASVVGRDFTLAVLERLLEKPADRLLELLDEAVQARLVTETPGIGGARYRFAHALVRETLYEELSAARRLRLHRTIGEVLEVLYAENLERHLDELAYHFFEAGYAGEADKSIDYLVRAGRHSVELLAYEEAAGHFDRALQALELYEQVDQERRCELLLALGDAQWRSGEIVKARASCQTAASIARPLGRTDLIARAALGFAIGMEFGRVDEEAVALLDEAHHALQDEESTLAVRVASALARALFFEESLERPTALARRAVDIARGVGDPLTLASALDTLTYLEWGPDSIEDRLVRSVEMLHLAEQAGSKELMLEAYMARMIAALEIGDVQTVDRSIAAYSGIAEELRRPLYLLYALSRRAMRALMSGRFDEAFDLSRQARDLGNRAGEPDAELVFGSQSFFLGGERGDRELVKEATDGWEEYLGRVSKTNRIAHTWLWLGKVMLDEVEFVRERYEATPDADIFESRRDLQWMGAMTAVAVVATVLGDARRASLLYDLLLPYESRVAVAGGAVICLGPVAMYLGALALTTGKLDESIRHLEASEKLAQSMQSTPFVARTRLYLARSLLARDAGEDRQRSLEVLSRCLASAREMGMSRLLEQALAVRLEAQGLSSTDVLSSIDSVASAVERERPDLSIGGDGTVTILFTDIENSTQLTEQVGDEPWLHMLRTHNGIVREQVRAYLGNEVKSLGDGFMITFSEPRRALECAVAVQRRLSAHGREHPDEAIRVRIGLHTGEAIAVEGDFYGKHVNLAARVAGAANGGEILITAETWSRLGDEFEIESERTVTLKGITGEQQVVAVAWD